MSKYRKLSWCLYLAVQWREWIVITAALIQWHAGIVWCGFWLRLLAQNGNPLLTQTLCQVTSRGAAKGGKTLLYLRVNTHKQVSVRRDGSCSPPKKGGHMRQLLFIYLYTPIHHRITANGRPGSHAEVSTGWRRCWRRAAVRRLLLNLKQVGMDEWDTLPVRQRALLTSVRLF